MSHAAKIVGDVGMSRDERSMLLGNRGDSDGGPAKQLLGVLAQVREIAEAVVDGRAGALWTDECMNQLILGVELGLAQGWNDIVDAFSDAGRILQSYEMGGRSEDSTLYLIDAYDLLCALSTDAMNGSTRQESIEKWRARYQEEVGTLEASGLALVSDDFEEVDAEDESPFEFPEAAKNIVRLRPQDDLPSLDELPPLDSVISGGTQSAPQTKRPAPVQNAGAPNRDRPSAPVRASKSPVEVAREAEEAKSQAAADAIEDAEIAAASGKGAQPSGVVVEFVDRICEELAGLSQHSEEDRVLSLEMIQGGIAALKREAVKDDHRLSGELCDEMMKACLFVGQGAEIIDERFTDLAFGFCGVYVEAMNNPTSENVAEWRSECSRLIEDWAESASEYEAPTAATPDPLAIPEEPEPAAEEVQDEAAPVEIVEAETPVEKAPVAEFISSAPPAVTPIVAAAPASAPRAFSGVSTDLFMRAQEALARGDGEAAKGLALQAAAMIAETEVDKAETRLRDAEARLKGNVSQTEEARSEVKHVEKVVMNAASDVAGGETNLGKAKSYTAKLAHELTESEAEVAEIDRQIAELMARREDQVREVEARQGRLEEAKAQESEGESLLEALREKEKESRKTLEAARQRVKDHQRITTEIENEMERARETLSRQRTSLSDIRQTINRPEPIKTGEPGEDESLLF